MVRSECCNLLMVSEEIGKEKELSSQSDEITVTKQIS